MGAEVLSDRYRTWVDTGQVLADRYMLWGQTGMADWERTWVDRH